MSDAIVDRILKSKKKMEFLNEDVNYRINEADDDEDEVIDSKADEEYRKLNSEEDDIEDDSTAPEQGKPDDEEEDEPDKEIPSSPGRAIPSKDFSDSPEPEEGEVEQPTEEKPKASAETQNTYDNPLDNQYAIHYTLGDNIKLEVEGDTLDVREGVVDGYDIEGFYRVRWTDGTTTNGLTDIAISELVVKKTDESHCVCGSQRYVNEGKYVVCDRCGRRIRESSTIEIIEDKPKKKNRIRAEQHPISTAVKPSIAESENTSKELDIKCDICGTVSTYIEEDIKKDYQTRKSFVRCKYPGCYNKINVNDRSIKDIIKEALNAKYLKESEEEEISEDAFSALKSLDREFWTRKDKLKEDIEDLGYIVEEMNDEYVVVSSELDDENTLLIPVVGTSRTITLDFDKLRMI